MCRLVEGGSALIHRDSRGPTPNVATSPRHGPSRLVACGKVQRPTLSQKATNCAKRHYTKATEPNSLVSSQASFSTSVTSSILRKSTQNSGQNPVPAMISGLVYSARCLLPIILLPFKPTSNLHAPAIYPDSSSQVTLLLLAEASR